MGDPSNGKRFRFIGTGTCLPSRVLTNHDLEAMVETSDEWIRDRTGIEERRMAADDQATSDLAAEALRGACEQAGISPNDLDAIVLATSTPDTVFPSTACWVQRKLEISGMPVFDVSAGCTGWLYALELAANLIAGKTAKRVGVIGAEVMSRVIDWSDRSTCVLFGDGAGAAVIEASEDPVGMLSSNWGADGNLAPILYQPAGGTRKPASSETVAANEHTVHMDGSSVFRHAVRAMVRAAKTAIEEAGLTPDELDLLIPHQANSRIMDACLERTGMPREKLFSIIHKYGNMSAACIPIAIHEARAAGRIKDGSQVVFTAFGTGLTWGGAVLRF